MGKNTVLIVEDNERNMRLAADLLELGEFQVLKAFDGESALEILKTQHPDLILLDLRLPGISGYEVYRTIRKDDKLSSVKIVAFTASVMKDEKENVLAAGFDGFIDKPIDTTNFVKEVRKILETD